MAEDAFKHVDLLLAIGVKFSEVSTGFYSDPQPRQVIHVDANPCNLGRVLRTDVDIAEGRLQRAADVHRMRAGGREKPRNGSTA